ncbi:MAG: LexA family transcriptional regulator [Mogibacterium sp.]|nr:LexA family transcriptional regulator [Mogibacterium sp.]
MNFLDRIEYYCKEHRVSHSRFEALADLSRGQISKWIHKGIFPNHRSQQKVAALLGISIEELMLDFRKDLHQAYSDSGKATAYDAAGGAHPDLTLPRLPTVLDWTELSRGASPRTQFFVLPAIDDSMSPCIRRDDRMVIHAQDRANSGDIVILRIGNEMVCRMIFTQEGGMILQSSDNMQHPVYYSSDDIHILPVSIIGRVEALVHHFVK